MIHDRPIIWRKRLKISYETERVSPRGTLLKTIYVIRKGRGCSFTWGTRAAIDPLPPP